MKRIVAGPNAVVELLRSAPGSIETIYVAESLDLTTLRRIEELAKHIRVEFEALPKIALDKMAKDLRHQGVIAVTGAFPYVDLDSIIQASKAETYPLIVALDQVQDPRNLGAILRSSYVFGACGVIITKDRAAGVTPVAVKTSAGTSELLRVARVTNLVRCLDQLADEGFQIYGAAADGTSRLHAISWNYKCVLVMGGEGKGLRRHTKEHCDKLFSIPMIREFDSLNVSAAAAIALYEAARQRSLH